jgi:hypothetical protein
VIHQCLNAPYTDWPERFPPAQQGVLASAERTGALLVSLENLYGYGPTGGAPMIEDLPLAATMGEFARRSTGARGQRRGDGGPSRTTAGSPSSQ